RRPAARAGVAGRGAGGPGGRRRDRLPRAAGLQDRGHLLPPARLLGPHRPRSPVPGGRAGERHPTAGILPGAPTSPGDQEPPRLGREVAGGTEGDRVRPWRPRRRLGIGEPRSQRHELGARPHGRGPRGRRPSRPGCAEYRLARPGGRRARGEHPRALRRRRRCVTGARGAPRRRHERRRGRVTGVSVSEAPLPHEDVRFAHNSERQFAKLLDFYSIGWEYEPRTFTLERDRDGRPAQAFTPDFYLPAYDLYIEITTLNQKLVTKKNNRKGRRLRELHPDVRIKVLYQRDYLHLLVKYGLEPPSQLSEQFGEGGPLRFDVDGPAVPARPMPRRAGSEAESA